MKIQILLATTILSVMAIAISACTTSITSTTISTTSTSTISTTTIAQQSHNIDSGGGTACYTCQMSGRNKSSPNYYYPVYFLNPQNKHVMIYQPKTNTITDTNVPFWVWIK